MPICLLNAASSNWYSCCKDQIKKVKGLLCTFRFFWQQLGKQTLKVFLVSWQEKTLRAHFEPFYFSLIHSPFHQNLICGDGLVQYTPEYVQCAPKHQCSVENTSRAPSTAGGLVCSGQGHITSTTLDWSSSKGLLA